MDWTATWTAVGAFGTLSLAAATFYLALQSRRTIGEMAEQRKLTVQTVDEMVKQREEMARQHEATNRAVAEMETSRELASMPILSAALWLYRRAPDLQAPIEDLREHTTAMINNIGNAPALEVTVIIYCPARSAVPLASWPKDEPDSNLLMTLKEEIGPVGLDGSRSVALAFQSSDLLGDTSPVFHAPIGIELRYQNVYGRWFSTTAIWHCRFVEGIQRPYYRWHRHLERFSQTGEPIPSDPPLAVFRS